MIDQSSDWWPLATSVELKPGKAISRTLLGMPLVLFRDGGGDARALADRCPHRHARLSAGKVLQGEIECPYHGWRFDGLGRCTRVPGLASHRCTTQGVASAISTQEQYGLVWGCINLQPGTRAPVPPALDESSLDVFFMTDRVVCGMAEAAENFLDGFHTHFVHAGWIRRDGQRQPVTARVRALPDGVEAHYSNEGLQSGLISRLFEGDRTVSMGRFRMPGIAEIEYQGKRGLNLLVTTWLTPETSDSLRIHARIATRREMLPSWLKKLVLRQLFGVILRQDKAILESTASNAKKFSDPAPDILNSPLDLLGPHIRRMLAGQPLFCVDQDDLMVHL